MRAPYAHGVTTSPNPPLLFGNRYGRTTTRRGTPPTARRHRAQLVRRPRPARRVDGRHRRSRRRHQAGAVSALHLQARAVLRAARRGGQDHARCHRTRDQRRDHTPRAGRSGSRRLLPVSWPITTTPSCCSLATGRGATRNSPPRSTPSRASWLSSSRALIDVDLDTEHRLLLAHAVVGLAEGASRRWVAAGAQETPEEAAQRVADLAWAGLRAVHR